MYTYYACGNWLPGERANELKEEILDMLSCVRGPEQVCLIDALYNYGASYQFGKEIEEALKNMLNTLYQ